jgi:indole-3-glycerol phosphate synthase
MVHAVPDILARIAASKERALRGARARRAELERRAAQRTDFRDFCAALRSHRTAIIAEIKKASPSRGTLADQFDPASLARQYVAGGAAALSVLTDAEFFQGSLQDLETARAAVPAPVLRKDFTLDEFHVIEAAAHNADAILLIAALLDQSQMRRLRELAANHRMAALVEVHDEEELESAVDSGAEILGVNNRNLHTFETDLETSLRLAKRIPSGVLAISESGIHSSEDIRRLEQAGFRAFLVGEHLMTAADPVAALLALQS